MASPWIWARYLASKAQVSYRLAVKAEERLRGTDEVQRSLWKLKFWRTAADNFMNGRLMFRLRTDPGDAVAMDPTLSTTPGESIIVRTLLEPSSKTIFVDDVVVVRGQEEEDRGRLIIRRVAAMEGEEMVSDDPDDEAFVIPPACCWLLGDNQKIQPSESGDSRVFDPWPINSIIGRAVYVCRSPVDHGHIINSEEAMRADSSILAVELDTDSLTLK
eukprot:TRINITY_DN3563_c0_g1_i1.p1 TRINITY_DN3563_c0_g1~~TRINITY_DN3563_c0_g1_i1.p1  ORF type:complete len:217 (-),score=62.00 TRINITY_DN3563_c0_g1_i1:127-777(-)